MRGFAGSRCLPSALQLSGHHGRHLRLGRILSQRAHWKSTNNRCYPSAGRRCKSKRTSRRSTGRTAKFKASRSLLPEQQSTVVDAIKAFAGQEFAGAVAASVPDAWSLWETLDQTLRAAHWVRRPPWGLATGHPPAGIPVSPNEGVTIFVPQDDLVSLAPAVDALSSALNAAGLKTYVARDAGPQTRPKIIVVEIGTKPQ